MRTIHTLVHANNRSAKEFNSDTTAKEKEYYVMLNGGNKNHLWDDRDIDRITTHSNNVNTIHSTVHVPPIDSTTDNDIQDSVLHNIFDTSRDASIDIYFDTYRASTKDASTNESKSKTTNDISQKSHALLSRNAENSHAIYTTKC